jgi:4-amino-4-deoxy-L-arabinose transferase-like glycosyltransferase
MVEIILVLLIFICCLILIRVNFLSACVLALVLSTFLHKELFSLYIWDLLPVRILMGAFLVNSLYEFIKFNGFSWKFLKYLKDPLVLISVLFVVSKLISTFNSLDLKTSLFLDLFYIAALNFVLSIYFKLKASEVFDLYKKYIFIAFIVSLIPFIQIYLYFNNNYLFGAILNVAGLNINFPSFSLDPSFFMDALKLIVMTRVGSIFWDVNHFGGFLAGLFVPSLALVLISKGKELRNNLIYFIFISSGLFLTNSRSAWLLGFVSILIFSIFTVYRKIGKKGVMYSVLGIGLFSLLAFSLYQDKNSLFREKVRSYFHYRMDSFDSHFLLLSGAVDVFNRYPIIGGGTGSFFEHFKETPTSNEFLKRDPAGLSGRVPAHSIWGEVMAESGSIGIFVFVAMISLLLGIYFYSISHSTDWKDYFIFSSFLSTLFGWLVAGVFYSYNSEFFFILMFFPAIYAVKKLDISYEEVFLFLKIKNYYLKFLIFLIAISLMLYGLGDNKLITFDESIYAKVAKNMYESGDLLTLRWRNNSDLWFEKPPLYFILTSYMYSLLDVSEFSTRIVVVIFSFLGLVYTYKLAKIIFNSVYIGLFAVFGLILNVSYLYYSRIGMLDVMLTSLIVASIYYFIKFNESKNRFDLVISGVFIGLGVLTKSIIGFLPLVIVFIYYLILNFGLKKKDYKFLDLVIVGFTALVISAPWHIHMYQVYGDKFVKSYLGYHLIERYSTEIEDKGAPWYFYFVVIRNTMRVWFLFLIPALGLFIYKFYKKNINYRALILVVSILTTLFLFSSSSSKLKWYIMPIYPFLYIICGYFVHYVFLNLSKKLNLKLQLAGLLFYLFIFLNLGYLYTVRDMVYTADFNKKQAELVLINNSLPNVDITYIDKIDYPLGLFYNEKLNAQFVTYSSFKGILETKVNDPESITFITGQSRFESLKRNIPQLVIIAQNDDFVLASLNYSVK